MKRARELVTSFFLVGALATACATTTDDGSSATAPADAGTSVTVDSGSITLKDSGSSTPVDSGSIQTKTCTPNCHTDSDCQSSCPAAPNGGINCCDVSSGVCFSNASGTCTAAVDAGTD